jgi:hypothetical protein
VNLKLFLLLIFAPLACLSQQRNTHQLFWFRLTVADTINKRLEWQLSFQQRTQNNHSSDTNIFHSFQFQAYAVSFEYFLTENFSVSVMPLGYYRSHVLNVLPSDQDRPSVKEWRSNIQFSHEVAIRKYLLLNRISLDHRRRDFDNNRHYTSNWRARYMIRLEKDVFGIFSDTKPITFTLFNEVFFQFGDAVKNSSTLFDQNRLYAGGEYEIFRNVSVSLGYAYGFQIRPSGDQSDDINSYYVALTFENFVSQFSKPKTKIRRRA